MKENTRTQSAVGEPTVDLMGHLRGLLKVAPLAIVIGIVVAVGVYGYQSLAATRYQASVVAQIVTPGSSATGQSGPTSTDSITAAGPFVALAGDQQVLAQIAKTSGVGVDASQLSTDIVVAASTVPGIVDITAEADSASDASALAKAVVTTLDSTYTTRQQAAANAPAGDGMGTALQSLTTQLESLASQLDGVIAADGPASGILTALRSQIDQLRSQQASPAASSIPPTAQRLILLAQPAGGPKASSIPPIAIAGVAGIIAFILAAELLVLARSFLGRSVNREWARRIGRRTHSVIDIPGRNEEISTSTLATVARASGPVLIVASEQVRGVVGRIVSHVHGRVDGRDIDDDEWTPDERDHSLAVVVVRDGQVDRSRVVTALDTLASWNIPSILVVAPNTRGTLSLPGGLAVAFRKPSQPAAPVRPAPVQTAPGNNQAGPSAPVGTTSPAPGPQGPVAAQGFPAPQGVPAPQGFPVPPAPVATPTSNPQAPALITPHDPVAGYLPYRPLPAEQGGTNGMTPVPPAPGATNGAVTNGTVTNGVETNGVVSNGVVSNGATPNVPEADAPDADASGDIASRVEPDGSVEAGEAADPGETVELVDESSGAAPDRTPESARS